MRAINTNIFESQAQEYDSWFDNHPELFKNECMVLKKAIPVGIGIEIGVGTGRFAEVFKIAVGVEPAHAMAQMAIARGITVINAKAEYLPFHSLSFDYAVMITTDCFLDNIVKAFTETHRIIKKNGTFIAAMIDKDSELGKLYEAKRVTSIWYKDANFHSVHEITNLLQQAGFTNFDYWQTLFTDKEELTEPLPGFGKGGFVVIRSQKI